MIRNRLIKLEKLVTEAMANCPGCALIPSVILMPGDPEPTATVLCARCGRAHPPAGIRFVVPGLTGPVMAMD